MNKKNTHLSFVSNITPEEYERSCLTILKKHAQNEGLQNFKIEHNQIVNVYDGKYQIDIHASFMALGTIVNVIIECKRYSKPVERKVVVELDNKRASLGMQAAMLISTSGFQIGAKLWAAKHGIILAEIVDRDNMIVLDLSEFRSSSNGDTGVDGVPEPMEYDIRRKAFRNLFLFLASKRVFDNPMFLEIKDECVESVLEIKKVLTDVNQNTQFADEDMEILLKLVNACNKYLDVVRKDSIPFILYKTPDGAFLDASFSNAMKRLRTAFKTNINEIEKRYGLKYVGNISEIR